jgi:hypothetical protein
VPLNLAFGIFNQDQKGRMYNLRHSAQYAEYRYCALRLVAFN